MQLLKEKILTEGKAINSQVLKVDSFLNHQIDVEFMNEIGKEFKRRFLKDKITKILTIEASGIGIACITAQYFNVPVVFAKKTESKNLDSHTYQSEVYSFTKSKNYTIRVSKKYLNNKDNVLIIDDFLANGKAAEGLVDIINQSNANLIGIGIVIEKAFQPGGNLLRDKNIKLESLAIIKSLEKGIINFV